MGMDVDYIAAKNAIQSLETILLNVPHGEREEISEDIEEFVEKMGMKYGTIEDSQ